MKRLMLLAMACMFAVSAFSQKIPLINSGEVITRGKASYDSGKYEEAIVHYLSVPKRDTNYVYMVTELALAYTAAKKYDSALARCKEGLNKPSIYRDHFMRTTATALDNKGEFDQAVAAMKKASEEYPFDVTLIFNLGITYYNHKDYQKAEDCFFKALSINPFHAGSHLNLGRLSIGQGRKTHALLSLGMYLGISNTDNERLVLLDRFLSNQVTDEGSLAPAGTNACEKLDQILKAKIAMDKNFKTKVPVDAPVVRQVEMFFEQLSTISESTDDRWVAHYLPIYKALKEKNVVVPFIYHILSSVKNDQVQKWRQKNEKELNAFFSVANAEISKPRKFLTVPSSFGYDKPVQGWYSDKNRVESIGMKDATDKNEGQWYYYHDNYERSAEGKYSAGIKKGTWKYYHSDGSVKSIENYDTGEVTVFDSKGNKSQRFSLKGEDIDGEVELFHPCGGIEEKRVYKTGKRNGPSQSFYANGQKNSLYNYTDDNLNGPSEVYFDNGQMFSKGSFKDDLRTGPYVEYYINGKPQMTGEYTEGKVNGTWRYFHTNGNLHRTGKYVNGVPVGEWAYYDTHGTISEKRNFDNDGNWNGDNTTYHNGKIYYVQTFRKDLITKMTFFDQDGKEIYKAGNENGTFQSKSFYPNGQLNGEGSYRKGKINGLWTYHFPEGMKMSEYTYVDGEVQGKVTEYYRTGSKQSASEYKDDELHGYYIDYHANGNVQREGWYQNGQRQQQWLEYFIDGTPDSDYFYLNGEITGAAFDYATNGKLHSITTYDADKVENILAYNSKGENLIVTRNDGNKKIYEIKYPSGKNRYQFIAQCGEQVERFTKWFPDGHILYSYGIVNSRRHGEYVFYGIENEVEVKGFYVNGSREGLWTGFANKQMDYQGRYFNDKTDSVWTYYFYNGKISSTITYKNGTRTGITQMNSPDGLPVLEKQYDDDNLIAYRQIGSDGKFGDWIKIKGDAAIVVNYPAGGKVFEETYKSGLLEGTRKLYFPDGKLCSEYNYKAGDYEGEYMEFFSGGKLKEKRIYKDDELNGAVEFYNEDGSLLKTEEYLNGYREGKAIFYKNGVKAKEILFWGNEPIN